MADDDYGLASSPRPIGGAALRQARRRDPSLLAGPPPPPADSTGLWTQFSGMPNQPGSPTSLHAWLQSVDDASISGGRFPSTSSPDSGSRNNSFDSFSAADFLSAGIGHQEKAVNAPPSVSMTHPFDFGAPPGFRSAHDYRSQDEFSRPRSSHFSHSHSGHMSSLAADMSGLPPADFSQPPPDFSFGTHHPEFSQPHRTFLSDLPHHNPAADMHQNLPDFLTAHSTYACTHGRRDATLVGEQQLRSNIPAYDTAVLDQSVSRPQNSVSGHVDMSLPPSSFTFSSRGDDMLFPSPVDFEGQSPILNLERATHTQKKVQRQNSEPMCGGAAVEEGKAMYMDALRRLNSFSPSGPSYEPFGSAALPHEKPPEVGGTFSEDVSTSKSTKKKEFSRKEPSKPSYSDVAKANKGKPQTEAVASEKAEPEILLKNSAEPTVTKPHRQQAMRRPYSHTRSINQRAKTSQADGTHSSYVQPNSRYGLDQFEDLSDFASPGQRSSSVESLNSQINQGLLRRSSNSSVSSSTSAVEEAHAAKSSVSGGLDIGGSRYNMNGTEVLQERMFHTASNISSSSSMGQQTQKATPNPVHTASQKTKSEKLFFDPKRIFQSGSNSKVQTHLADKTKSADEKVRCDSESSSKEETILNNGKPNNTTSKATAASHRKADYINNDLREGSNMCASSSSGGAGSSKRTNQTAAFNRQGHGSRKNGSKDSQPQNVSGADRSRGVDSRGRRQGPADDEDNSFIRNIDWVLVDDWMKYIVDCIMTFARNSFSAVLTLLIYLLGIIMYLVMGAIHLIAVGMSKLWNIVRNRLFKDQGSGSWSGFGAGAESARKRFGLEENITLPATGEEAIKRLLACKGKDPYSILGVRTDASEEDIKRYYRRQAVLVHPDKNQEPGAEEAFKILGHASEMIGDPTKRREYDAHIFETKEAETAMREFSDLLTKLQEKVQEAANMMRCDHCGGKHRRIPVDRAWYSARFCDRCNIHHLAKEGDVWAESSMLGFLWHYFACMDNNIYDITEWVSCQRENFKHMKANAHPVYYRIQTDSSRRHRQGQSGEADLEDFINRLFNKASMPQDGASPPGWQFPSQQAGGAGASQSSWGQSSASSSTASTSKRSRRKKKRN